MFVDLQKVPPEGQAFDCSLSVGSFDLDREDFRLAEAVTLEGRIVPVEPGVFRLTGGVATRIIVPCVRCLESFEMAVDESLDLLYLPQSANTAPVLDDGKGLLDVDRGLSSEELAAAFYRDERIDLREMVVEQIVLSLPMKPLCRPDCRGLCPECGANRNDSDCECSPDETDPRWATLKTLLGR